ncbi:DUF402 domain-containing protein [Bacillus sp. Marseille-Q3570]|uniref:DUF402 domain-containing protein n=1 Tax=Bacillus sp. Marseille-Q3570 TaxID=2963522 RepID=UPI0021B7C529|nr:DUF402 domain-containing protein [Bacillus sp. Marseille-Q3570]
MLKRKSGDRKKWERIRKRRYAQYYLDTESFKGHITLLKMDEIKEPLNVQYGELELCIADKGYSWLQQFPDHMHHSVTTMFDAEGEIIQWYIDICSEVGLDENGVPWMDDLFLDIVVLPSGEIILKDDHELKDALEKGTINQTLHQLAVSERDDILSKWKQGEFSILDQAEVHMKLLQKLIEVKT